MRIVERKRRFIVLVLVMSLIISCLPINTNVVYAKNDKTNKPLTSYGYGWDVVRESDETNFMNGMSTGIEIEYLDFYDGTSSADRLNENVAALELFGWKVTDEVFDNGIVDGKHILRGGTITGVKLRIFLPYSNTGIKITDGNLNKVVLVIVPYINNSDDVVACVADSGELIDAINKARAGEGRKETNGNELVGHQNLFLASKLRLDGKDCSYYFSLDWENEGQEIVPSPGSNISASKSDDTLTNLFDFTGSHHSYYYAGNMNNGLINNTMGIDNYSWYPMMSGEYIEPTSGNSENLVKYFELWLNYYIGMEFATFSVSQNSGYDSQVYLSLGELVDDTDLLKVSDEEELNKEDYANQFIFMNQAPVLRNSAFANYLKSVVTYYSDDPEVNYTMTKRIYDSLTSIVRDAKKKAQEEAANQAQENTGSEKAEEVNKIALQGESSVMQWFYLINNFFVTGETSDEDNMPGLDLGMYGGVWVEGRGELGWKEDEDIGLQYFENYKQVSMEEDLRIRIYYTILRNYLIVNNDELAKKIDDECTSDLDKRFSLLYTTADGPYLADQPTRLMNPEVFPVRGNDSVNTLTTAQSEATAASDKFKKETDKPSLKTTANNFEAIMKYFYYGAVTPNAEYSESGGGTSNVVKLNKNINSIVPEFPMDTGNGDLPTEEQTVSVDILNFESLGLPLLPQTKEIGNSYQSIQKYGQIMLSLMYIKRWAAVSTDLVKDENDEASRVYKSGATGSYSGLKMKEPSDISTKDAESSNFANPVIDEWLLSIASEEDQTNIKPTPEVSSYIQYYIQIYKGLDYLGCHEGTYMYDSWIGPELQKIMEYYDSIKNFENKVSAQDNEMDTGDEQSFSNIFNDDNKAFMAHYAEGVAASATYVPLITDLYNPESWSIIPTETFIEEFHYKYGFLRKALYRDVTPNAAMSYYVTGNIGNLKPVTLRDFMENDGSDLVLYIDPKMYRIDKVSEKYNLAYSRLQNVADAGEGDEDLVESMSHAISTWMETDAESICKTGTAKVYSQEMANSTDAKGKRAKGWRWDDKNHYIMEDADIEYYLHGNGSDEDEIQKAFAVVSGVYRDKSVFNIVQNESASPKPVFVSSKSLCNLSNVTQEEFNTIYNYMMVINLKNKQGVDYNIDMDLDLPVFMDVYGNICSMSGIIIIPAVSNATLYNATNYDAANSGLASLYNDLESEKIKVSWLKNTEYLDNVFGEDDNREFYEMQNKIYEGGTTGRVDITFANLALSSSSVKEKMYEIAYANAMSTDSSSSGIAGSKFNRRVNLIIEVLRGADIEDIDLQKEGLSGYTGIDKTGIYVAYRVEQLGSLIMANSNGNSLLELPNLAFLPGLEYVTVVLFKILFAVMVVLLLIQVYLDGVGGSIGIKTIASYTFTIASIVISVIALPTLINYSYYNINKLLLQNEATYMEILNLEKRMNGQEISISQSSTGQPQTTTKFYLKLDEIKVPWWSIITDVLSSDTFTKMQDIYDSAMNASVYSQFGDGNEDAIIKRGNSLYADVDWIFSTSRVEFASYNDTMDNSSNNETSGYLYQNVTTNPKMSYLMPYYAILDNLLANVAQYNEINNVVGYTSIPSGNDNEQILTKGLLKPYFTSFEFMESDTDLLGLYYIYGVAPPKDKGTIFTDDEIASMRRSLWCNYEGIGIEGIKSGLEELDMEAKRFIVNNRGMLDKVSDATFIKCMALYLSTRHNNIMHVPACRGLEIYAIDARDIMRLSLTNKNIVMKNSHKSFEKFCYDEGGTFSIILAGFLEIVYWITSLVKPAVMIVLMLALMFSYIYKKLLRLQNNHSLEGYLVSVALICLVNILYALSIKLSMTIPKYVDNIIMCLLVQLILQIGYSIILLNIANIVLHNIRDIGFYTYKTIYDTHMSGKVHAVKVSVDNVVANSILSPITRRRKAYNSTSYTRTRDLTGNNILSDMRDREVRRRDNVYNGRR